MFEYAPLEAVRERSDEHTAELSRLEAAKNLIATEAAHTADLLQKIDATRKDLDDPEGKSEAAAIAESLQQARSQLAEARQRCPRTIGIDYYRFILEDVRDFRGTGMRHCENRRESCRAKL